MSGRNAAAGGHARSGEQWAFGQYVSRRNAAVLQISSLVMIIFCGLMVIAVSVLIAGRRHEETGAKRPGPVATVVALTSALGLLLSAATIYLTYRPYWYIFQRAILNGDASQARDLREFLMAIRALPFIELGSNLTRNLPTYFWAGVTLFGIIGLVIILLRHFRGRPSAGGLQNHPRVP